eukprot:1881293-Amphidinium_carterae.1
MARAWYMHRVIFTQPVVGAVAEEGSMLDKVNAGALKSVRWVEKSCIGGRCWLNSKVRCWSQDAVHLRKDHTWSRSNSLVPPFKRVMQFSPGLCNVFNNAGSSGLEDRGMDGKRWLLGWLR